MTNAIHKNTNPNLAGDYKKPPRNPNIEVFRVFTMFAIVLYHSFIHRALWQSPSMPLWEHLFISALVWHVPAFIAISGWFGIKTTASKFIKLYGIVLFSTALSATYNIVNTGHISLRFFRPNAGWFGSCYLVFMFLAPLLNAAVDMFSAKGKTALRHLGIYMAFIAILGTNPACHCLGINNFFFSHSCGMMLLVYVSARIARKYWTEPIGMKPILITTLIFAAGQIAISIIDTNFEHTLFWEDYSRPHVYIFAIALLMLFYWQLHFPAWLGKTCTFLGPSMFGVYLLHYETPFGCSLYRIPQVWMAEHTCLHPAIIVTISAILTFAAALSIDLVRRAGLFAATHAIKKIRNRN